MQRGRFIHSGRPSIWATLVFTVASMILHLFSLFCGGSFSFSCFVSFHLFVLQHPNTAQSQTFLFEVLILRFLGDSEAFMSCLFSFFFHFLRFQGCFRRFSFASLRWTRWRPPWSRPRPRWGCRTWMAGRRCAGCLKHGGFVKDGGFWEVGEKWWKMFPEKLGVPIWIFLFDSWSVKCEGFLVVAWEKKVFGMRRGPDLPALRNLFWRAFEFAREIQKAHLLDGSWMSFFGRGRNGRCQAPFNTPQKKANSI